MPTTEKIENLDTLTESKQDAPSPHDKLEETRSRDSISSCKSILEAENRILAERKLVRKLDFRLLPTIVLIFIMNFIDVACSMWCNKPLWSSDTVHLENRSHNGAFEGVGSRPRSNGYVFVQWLWIRAKPSADIQYDTVVAVLYASYCPAQIPSNMVRRLEHSDPYLDFGLCQHGSTGFELDQSVCIGHYRDEQSLETTFTGHHCTLGSVSSYGV